MGLISLTLLIPVLFFHLTILPKKGVCCLENLLMRITLNITNISSLKGVRSFE